MVCEVQCLAQEAEVPMTEENMERCGRPGGGDEATPGPEDESSNGLRQALLRTA